MAQDASTMKTGNLRQKNIIVMIYWMVCAGHGIPQENFVEKVHIGKVCFMVLARNGIETES
jgi:hypothetical protein